MLLSCYAVATNGCLTVVILLIMGCGAGGVAQLRCTWWYCPPFLIRVVVDDDSALCVSVVGRPSTFRFRFCRSVGSE